MCVAKADDTLSSTAILMAFWMVPRGTGALLVGGRESALWPAADVVEVPVADGVVVDDTPAGNDPVASMITTA